MSRTADRDLIDTVAAVHDHRVPGSKRLQRMRHRFDQAVLRDAQQMETRTRGIADRAHQIEDSADAQLASERCNLSERRMIRLREDVTAAGGVEASFQPFGIAID